MLADFHPKGAVGEAYGVYSKKSGQDLRSHVFIDADGVVQEAELADRERDMDELLASARQLHRDYGKELPSAKKPPGVPEGTRLFVRNNCGASRAAMAARTNLHLESRISLVNVSVDPDALRELEKLTGKTQAPCLLIDGEPELESAEIVKDLVTRATGRW